MPDMKHPLERLDKTIYQEIVVCMKTQSEKEEIKALNSEPQTFKCIHATKLLSKLTEGRGKKFPPATLYKYLDKMQHCGIVNRYEENPKSVVYEFNETKLETVKNYLENVEVSGKTLVEIGKLANNLNVNLLSYNQEIFFGIFGAITKEKSEKLITIRDSCRKIANMLDLVLLPKEGKQ